MSDLYELYKRRLPNWMNRHKYLLNSAVITKPGKYSYEIMLPEEAREWFGTGLGVTSAIGYEETAAALSALLEVPVATTRRTIAMQPYDEALVFRLVFPPGTPRLNPQDKGAVVKLLGDNHFELGLLRRFA